MRYLHVIASMDPRAGGPCQGIRNLTPQSLAAGHTVEVVCLDDPHADYLTVGSGQQRATSSELQKAEIGKVESRKQTTEDRGQRAEVGSEQRATSNETADAAARASLPIHALGQGRGHWAYHPALRPWLEKNLPRFDAVVLNGLWQYPAYVMSRLARRPETPPYFVFPHGMLDPWFQRAPERRWKAVRNWFYWKLIEQHVIARAAAVLFTCAEEMRLARHTFWPYQPKQQINVGYGISEPPAFHARMAAAFAQACPGLQGRPYFLFLGRLHPKKGVDILIRAYAKQYGPRDHETTDNETKVNGRWSEASREQGATSSETANAASKSEIRKTESRNIPVSDPNNQAFSFQLSEFQRFGARSAPPALVIAGPGLDSDYGRQMQRLAAEVSSQSSGLRSQVSGLSQTAPAVCFPGMLTGDAKWGALYGCDAFVLTSHQENFGIAVAEALACGKPVLISNQINIWREIADDRVGVVADDTLAGAEQLFQRWEQMSADEKAAMARAATACYLNRFGVATAAKNLLATMEEVLKKGETLKR